MCFSAAASSENDHGIMNLASKTAPVSLTSPSSVSPIHGRVRWTAWRWMSEIRLPEFCSYQRRLRSSVTRPSWTIRTPDRSRAAVSPRFSRQSRSSAYSSLPHDDPGIRAADELTAVGTMCRLSHFDISLWKRMGILVVGAGQPPQIHPLGDGGAIDLGHSFALHRSGVVAR